MDCFGGQGVTFERNAISLFAYIGIFIYARNRTLVKMFVFP